jgi:hypothetical protein
VGAVGGGEDPQEIRKAGGIEARTWQRLKEQPHQGRKTSEEVTVANGQGEECVCVGGIR